MASVPRRPPPRRPQTNLVIEGDPRVIWPCSDRISSADRTIFNLIFRVFELYKNVRSDSILNRLEMDLCIPQPRGNLFPSPDLRRYLHNSLVGATPRVSPKNANRVLNKMISEIKKTIEDCEGETPDDDELIDSVVVCTHKYVLLTKTAFEFRRRQLLEAIKPVPKRIDKNSTIYCFCKACEQRFSYDDNVAAATDDDNDEEGDDPDADYDDDDDDDDDVDDDVSEDDDAVMTLACAHRLHTYCVKKWCYQCPKCSFPLPRRNANQSIVSAIASSSSSRCESNSSEGSGEGSSK